MFDNLSIPPAITALAEAVHRVGGRAWLVGGGVRDHLMGRAVKDLDVEVHGLTTDALERVLGGLGRVDAVGRSFGVFKLRPRNDLRAGDDLELDVSIPRRDSNAGPGHRGIAVEGDPFMPLAEAVRRRDLTINALMVDVLTRELADPAGGMADLRAGVLRAVDASMFLDDPLRALRVVQFAARTGFHPDAELIGLCVRAPLGELPAERVQGEWGKLLLMGPHLGHGLRIAREAEVIARVFPEVVDEHALDDALDRARSDRDALTEEGPRWALMLATWLHATPLPGVEATLDRLWLHKVGGFPLRDQVLGLLAHREDPARGEVALRQLAVHVRLDLALSMRSAITSDPTWADERARADALGVLQRPAPPLLQGRHLAGILTPGPAMGRVLKEAYAMQLDGRLDTLASALAWARAERALRT